MAMRASHAMLMVIFTMAHLHPALSHPDLSEVSGRVEIISEPLLKRGTTAMDITRGDTYLLHVNSSRLLFLNPSSHLDKLTTGMHLTVRGRHIESTRQVHTSDGHGTSEQQISSIHSVESSSMDVHEIIHQHPGSDEEGSVTRRALAPAPEPLKALGAVSAIVVRVSQCGGSIKPSFSISDIYSAFFPGYQPKDLFTGQSNLNPKQTYSYQEAYNKCSYGKSRILPARFNIVPDTIDICSPSGAPFEICSNTMLPSIGALVQKHLQSSGYDTTKYDRIIMFLPAPATCPILGWGTVGCVKGAACHVWVMQTDVTLLMHESSHNFGLNHAEGYGEEYGDVSCSMASVPFVCYNAPNSWRLGWSSPTLVFSASTLPQGKPIPLSLPSVLSTSTNFVRIVIDWAPGQPALFLSYRVSQPPYDQLQPMVYLHTLPCDQLETATAAQPCKTNLVGSLFESGLWFDDAMGIRVSVQGISPASASVTVCRSNSPCANEPETYFTVPSKSYGWPGYRFYTHQQPAQPVGFWSDLAQLQGPLTGVVAWGTPLNQEGETQIVAIQSLFGVNGSSPGPLRGDALVDPASGSLIQYTTSSLEVGELFSDAYIQADSESGKIYTLTLVTDKGRSFSMGSCGPACQSSASSASPLHVTPPAYVANKGARLGGLNGASSRYRFDNTRSFLSQLVFLWTVAPSIQVNSPPPPSPSPPSPVPPPSPATGYKRQAPPLLSDDLSFYWDAASSGVSGVFDFNSTSSYLENGPITRLEILTQTKSLLTDGPALVGIAVSYGGVKGPAWGLSALPDPLAYTSEALELNSGEDIVSVTVRSVGGRSFSNPVDWLEGLSVTTSEGRRVVFGCLALGAKAGSCTGDISITSSPPPGFPGAIVGAFRGQYGMLVTATAEQNTPAVINFLSFRFAVAIANSL